MPVKIKAAWLSFGSPEGAGYSADDGILAIVGGDQRTGRLLERSPDSASNRGFGLRSHFFLRNLPESRKSVPDGRLYGPMPTGRACPARSRL